MDSVSLCILGVYMAINPDLTLGINRSLKLVGWLWRHWPFVISPKGCIMPKLESNLRNPMLVLRVTGLCAGNSPVPGEFPAQMASNAEIVSIWWRHRVSDDTCNPGLCTSGKASYHKILIFSKQRDWVFRWSYLSTFRQAPRQYCCGDPCKISGRSDNFPRHAIQFVLYVKWQIDIGDTEPRFSLHCITDIKNITSAKQQLDDRSIWASSCVVPC